MQNVSLPGAGVFWKVTKIHKGKFKFSRNEFKSVMAYACLTGRNTFRPETKVGHSDPNTLHGKVFAYGIKGTLGITG